MRIANPLAATHGERVIAEGYLGRDRGISRIGEENEVDRQIAHIEIGSVTATERETGIGIELEGIERPMARVVEIGAEVVIAIGLRKVEWMSPSHAL